MNSIDSLIVKSTIDSLIAKYPHADKEDITAGVKQTSVFWMKSDGTSDEFRDFCTENYIPDSSQKEAVFDKISRNLEIVHGYFNRMILGLREPVDMNLGPITPVDQIFGGYNPASHVSDDLFNNKIAFFILLNFKYYSLAERTALGPSWSRKQWALARLSGIIESRVPGELVLKQSDINSKAEEYISQYNIYVGNLVNEKDEKLFTENRKLISHWGLRDELKANYSDKQKGLEKQRMIYAVMKHIINQDIPSDVIDSEKYRWNPLANKLFNNNAEVNFKPEPDTRYGWLLENFKALKAQDAYNPFFPTYISLQFDDGMEFSQPEVERLFVSLVSSSQVKKVASLIEKRLGRKLEPFDIWYDGFKARESTSANELDKIVQKKYPNSDAFQKDIPNILVKLGFQKDKAEFIASKIQTDAARGSGHAWGAEMRGEKARLRTRISGKGMDYQSFNVAMHELGHCVEQTISLYDIDYYLLKGVPSTAFTEALAFIFQKRDIEMLGIKDAHNNKSDFLALDVFWSCYEIMGVSLVDMNVWKWLYQHPDATKEDLKKAVIEIAKEVWNKYYAEVFGIKDQPILAVYSHMINNPLYLSAYPMGFLIDFQLEKHLENKVFADEILRIYKQGNIIPQLWMKDAVGEELSTKPLLEAVDSVLSKINS